MTSLSHRWLVLLAMTGSLSMIMLDQTVVSVALPTMSRELGLSPSGATWVVNAYVLAVAALVGLGGRVGDRLGRVTAFRAGVITFVVASALCGLAPASAIGEPWIIGARALQGAGAALMIPVSAAIVIDAFAPHERGKAMSVYAGVSQVFLALGPVVGGVLTEMLSWRAVFWLNAPVGLAALTLLRVARPDDRRQAGVTMSPTGIALLVAGLTTTVLAVQQASVWTWTSYATLTTLTAGLTLTAAFVILQLRSPNPLLDVRLLAGRAFTGNVIVLTLVQFALLAVVLFSSLYQQDLLRLSPLQAGLGVLPLIAALAATAQLGGRWYDRAGVRPPALCGLCAATLGLITWAASLPLLAYLPQVPGMILTGVGLGLIMSPTNTDALSQVSAAQRSQASGIVQTARQLGGTLGVAIIGAVVLAVEHDGTHAGSHQNAADAITVGFACAALAFAFALAVGWRVLPPRTLDSDPQTRDDALT